MHEETIFDVITVEQLVTPSQLLQKVHTLDANEVCDPNTGTTLFWHACFAAYSAANKPLACKLDGWMRLIEPMLQYHPNVNNNVAADTNHKLSGVSALWFIIMVNIILAEKKRLLESTRWIALYEKIYHHSSEVPDINTAPTCTTFSYCGATCFLLTVLLVLRLIKEYQWQSAARCTNLLLLMSQHGPNLHVQMPNLTMDPMINLFVNSFSLFLEHMHHTGNIALMSRAVVIWRQIIYQTIQDPTIDINIGNQSNGYTPLHVACISSDLELVEKLVATNRVNLFVKDQKGFTPMRQLWHCSYQLREKAFTDKYFGGLIFIVPIERLLQISKVLIEALPEYLYPAPGWIDQIQVYIGKILENAYITPLDMSTSYISKQLRQTMRPFLIPAIDSVFAEDDKTATEPIPDSDHANSEPPLKKHKRDTSIVSSSQPFLPTDLKNVVLSFLLGDYTTRD